MPHAPRDPTALTPADLAKLLQKAGSRHASPEGIRDCLAAGAPTNGDGTIHLIHFAAWLVRAGR